jgi:membrane-bound serine protease (ClpP class)
MLIIVALVLLFLLPADVAVPVFIILALLGLVEIAFWHRRVRGLRRSAGPETMIGKEAVVVSPCRPEGQVQLDGEIWSATCDRDAEAGDRVRIVGRSGLQLAVTPLEQAGDEPLTPRE